MQNLEVLIQKYGEQKSMWYNIVQKSDYEWWFKKTEMRVHEDKTFTSFYPLPFFVGYLLWSIRPDYLSFRFRETSQRTIRNPTGAFLYRNFLDYERYREIWWTRRSRSSKLWSFIGNQPIPQWTLLINHGLQWVDEFLTGHVLNWPWLWTRPACRKTCSRFKAACSPTSAVHLTFTPRQCLLCGTVPFKSMWSMTSKHEIPTWLWFQDPPPTWNPLKRAPATTSWCPPPSRRHRTSTSTTRWSRGPPCGPKRWGPRWARGQKALVFSMQHEKGRRKKG